MSTAHGDADEPATGTAGRRGGDATGPDDVDRVVLDWRRERPDIDVGSIGIVSRIWRVGRHLEQQRKAQLDAVGSDRGSTIRRD